MKNPEKVRAEFRISITYDCNGATEDEIKAHLMKVADQLAGEGRLSGELGDSGTLVDDWSAQVETKVIT